MLLLQRYSTVLCAAGAVVRTLRFLLRCQGMLEHYLRASTGLERLRDDTFSGPGAQTSLGSAGTAPSSSRVICLDAIPSLPALFFPLYSLTCPNWTVFVWCHLSMFLSANIYLTALNIVLRIISTTAKFARACSINDGVSTVAAVRQYSLRFVPAIRVSVKYLQKVWCASRRRTHMHTRVISAFIPQDAVLDCWLRLRRTSGRTLANSFFG